MEIVQFSLSADLEVRAFFLFQKSIERFKKHFEELSLKALYNTFEILRFKDFLCDKRCENKYLWKLLFEKLATL